MLMLLATAFARPWAEVDAVWELRGERWRELPSSEEVLHDGQPLRRGDDLAPGDRVEVGEAGRVRVLYADGDQLVVGPGSSVVLDEDGLLQEAGEVLLDLEGAFRVLFGEVEAAVEGTRFVVTGEEDGAVRVEVFAGRVRVRGGGEELLLEAGEVGRVAPRPERLEREPSPDPGRRLLGAPRLQIGLTGATSWVLGDPHLALRPGLRVRIAPGWQLSLGAGLASSGERFHLPLELGVERRFGPLSLGASGLGLLGPEQDCDGDALALYPGLALTGRAVLLRRGPLELALSGRAGWLRGFTAETSLELSLAL